MSFACGSQNVPGGMNSATFMRRTCSLGLALPCVSNFLRLPWAPGPLWPALLPPWVLIPQAHSLQSSLYHSPRFTPAPSEAPVTEKEPVSCLSPAPAQHTAQHTPKESTNHTESGGLGCSQVYPRVRVFGKTYWGEPDCRHQTYLRSTSQSAKTF